ncbi:hypothetical protein HPP92_006159 [Vanilla planifolia]|uniref:Uncharacterized protein n=1 Tax=Vanilla planifolia TaxID=51239 RepID=A0A835VDV0_VANPL|nr:hypothetical protein HPP92_006159 [Vanilla planifolia]
MEDDDNFSEAVSGLSILNNSIYPSGSFSNLKVGDFMMDRFLPAAQAMATGSTHSAPKKAAKVENTIDNGDRRLARVPLPYQHRPNFAACYPQGMFRMKEPA